MSTPQKILTVGMVAGEPSGDLLGAELIKSLKKLHPDLIVVGIGGPQMIAAGCRSLYEMEKLSVMGLIEPLRHLPELFNIRRGLIRYFTAQKPDVFIGIDSPDFNLGLELKLRQAGIHTVHYVSPSVWAWRKKRVLKIKKAVDLILTLLPFEAQFYEQHQVPVKFVGHPLADKIPLHPDKLAARQALGLNSDDTYVALLPGSRRNELKNLSDVFLATAFRSWKQRPHLKFITSAANEKRNQEFQKYCQTLTPHLPITYYQGRSHDVLAAADVVLVASGTATLEAMLLKCPMVIAYRLAPLTYQIGKRLVKLSCVGLPNLLANEKLVPEFIQDEADPEKMSEALLEFLDQPGKVEMLQEKFLKIHLTLRRHASEQAANAIMELLK